MYKSIFKKTILILILVVGISPSIFAQTRITLNCKDASLREVMEIIQKQTSLNFAFTDNVNIDKVKVTTTIQNADLEESLTQILKPFGITFTIVGKQIILNPVKDITPSKESKIKVKGVITDEDGEPLPGVFVKDLSSETYSVSGANGSYSIEVLPSSYLNFSSMGMNEQKLAVNNRALINVTLSTDVVNLEDAIVTGYQTISKERSTASFSIIKGEAMKESAMSRGSILEGMEGLSSGLTINMNPNADSKYLVRGITSINSSKEPLFVLDGVPVSTEDVENLLSANDIETVTVLKDATAVSIWGSRAANGVIVISSKNGGNSNGKINVSYNGSYTYKGTPSLDYYNLMDSKTFIKNAVEVFEMEDYQTAYPESVVTTSTVGLHMVTYDTPVVLPHEQILYDYLKGSITLSERNNRLETLASQDGYASYQENFTSKMWNQNHTISLSGGTDKFKMYSSFGYEGNMGNSYDKSDSYKMNIKQEYKITKWLNWDLTLNVSHSIKNQHTNFLDQSNSLLTDLNNVYQSYLPYATLKNSDGSWVDYSDYLMSSLYRSNIENDLGISTEYHPVEDYFNSMIKSNTTRLRANTGLKVKLFKGLKYELRLQYLRGASNYENYIPGDTWYIRHARILATTSAKSQLLPTTGGDYQANNSFTQDWTVRNQFSYNNSFDGTNHQITALAGTESRESKSNGYNAFTRGYDYQTMTSTNYDITTIRNRFRNYFGVNSSPSYDNSTQSELIQRYISYYGNLAYTAFQKYSINGSIRIDQSNLFGTDVNSQYKPIGSVGLSWKMNKEKFLSSVNWINNLTLRVSYGMSGNSPLPSTGSPYDIINPSKHASIKENGYVISSPANKKICWEKTKTWNVGIDFSLIDNRISGAIDAYHKLTTDLLASKPLNVLTGYSSVYANVGSMKNQGIELSLSSINISSKDFSWTSNINVSYNANKVLEYYHEPTTSAYSKMSYGAYTEGYPAGAVWGFKWAGLRHEDGVPQVYDHEGNIQTDYNQLYAEDCNYFGSTIPKWSGSFTNNFNYKGFTLSAMIIFNLGHIMNCNDLLFFSGRFNYNRSNNFDKRWRQPGDEELTNIPSAYEDPYYSGRAMLISEYVYSGADINYQSASYAKLRELTLSYSLPSNLCKKLFMESAKLRLTGHDLLKVVANDKGLDPEVGVSGDYYGSYFSVGLSINF